MPWPVYSERFLHGAGTGSEAVEESTTVPDGRRWVVKMIVASTGDPATSWFIVYIHGHELMRFVFQATTFISNATMMVAYPRELVLIRVGGASTRVTMYGSELDDHVEQLDREEGTDAAAPIEENWHEEVRRRA